MNDAAALIRPSPVKTEHFDVLIVGAGPTGLMLANQLGRRGVRAMIIDRHDGPALQTRALGVQARTMEIYAKLGIVERALELGKRGTGATSVSLRKPNCRSQSMAMPEKTELKRTVMPTTPGAINCR